MEVNVTEFIEQEVKRLNSLFQTGAKMSGKGFTPFTVKDYTYLEESQSYFSVFTVPYFLSYSVLKDLEHRVKSPYPGTIWYFKKDVDKNKTPDFLPLQTKLMYDTLNSYIQLLKSGNHLQALILFRSYIEYSSQFYACLLDYEFFQKYTSNELPEEYKQLWFSTLKPGKVLAKIKSMHSEIYQLLQEKKIDYGKDAVYRRRFRPFDSELRGFLYSSLSGLAHGSYAEIIRNEIIKDDSTKLYSLVWLCSAYLIESHIVINEIASVYTTYTPKELFSKWVTVEIYLKSREPKAMLYVQNPD